MYRAVSLITMLAALGCGNSIPAGHDDDVPPDGAGAPSSLDLATTALNGGSGFTGFDGHTPTVYDFARDLDGSIVAAAESALISTVGVARYVIAKQT
ncbi:MAG: hypothetical protein ABI867_38705 [Kofleriaceae bacterium]